MPNASPELLIISELAEHTGTTPETIRYYERVGVLPAAHRQGNGRYRRYDATDVRRLTFIRRARDLGFSLDVVRNLLHLSEQPDHPCDEVDRLAREQLVAVDRKLEQLLTLREALSQLTQCCDSGHAMSECRILSSLGAPGRA
ncbi:MAG TPA: MerR family DNA-binding transcriptional regulator [Gemmatimonas aurantiaca]|uniref:MerR family transcriptional regulator n=2 Tax=Gemmatimonas aurantiaca TaxID=173480 RepID=C1ABN4_GEMAT|nr:helix-turn-helix domain-containing protein [Gemmatimonas aurantiaca]BAH39911.1 MerR family transcriptional regulator [Gemmatimonas aurantiaca T-27]HCT58078.1 MerR family DNA-binding transcriptional regulator [Gemmatimonas aurantiaca]